jgi:hypothetical protein
MAVQLSTIDALRDKMKQAPEVQKEKRTISKQDAIRELKRDIDAMQKRGYTIDDIAQFLTGGGLPITPPTLKSYLQRAKGPKQKEAKGAVSAPEPKPIPVGVKAKQEPIAPPAEKARQAPPAKAAQTARKGGFEVRADSDL